MELSVLESSRFRGVPVELYLFRYGRGTGSFFAYTNAEQVITFDGVSYEPIPISRDGIKTKGTLDKSMILIRFPKTSGLAELFRVYPPSNVVSVVVRQGHYQEDEADADFLVVTSGRVLNVRREGNEAIAGCETNQTSMRRTGLRRHYQYGCPHELYGSDCKATKKRFPARVVSIENTLVTVAAGWNTSGQVPTVFQGGLMEWESPDNLEPRTILRVLSGEAFLISGFLIGLEPGMTVGMVLGCPHDLQGCERIHNNVPNYGGCAWIPFNNPFGKNPF